MGGSWERTKLRTFSADETTKVHLTCFVSFVELVLFCFVRRPHTPSYAVTYVGMYFCSNGCCRCYAFCWQKFGRLQRALPRRRAGVSPCSRSSEQMLRSAGLLSPAEMTPRQWQPSAVESVCWWCWLSGCVRDLAPPRDRFRLEEGPGCARVWAVCRDRFWLGDGARPNIVCK